MEPFAIFALLIVGLFLLLSTRLPIAFSLGAVSIVGILVFHSSNALMHVSTVVHTYGMGLTLIVAPLFILMAEIINVCGFAEDIFDAAHKWLNWLPGSLASSTVAAAVVFSAICGSSVATAATIGLISIPQMMKRGYSKRLACGVTAVGGSLGIMIPPSLSFIIYGAITETSVARLFMAGVLPGILIATLLICSLTILSIMKPSIAPVFHEAIELREKYRSLIAVLPILGLIIIVLGSIYLGIATVEEAAAVGVVCALAMGVVCRRINWKALQKALLSTTRVTGMVFFIVFGGMVFAFLVTSLRIPQHLSEYVTGISVDRWMIMILIFGLYIVLGCLFEGIAMVVVTMPFIFPIVVGLGFDPIWFGVIIVVVTEIGLLTPPVGLNLFVLRGITPKEVTWSDILMGCLPFTLVLLASAIVLSIFPQIALWLPAQMR